MKVTNLYLLALVWIMLSACSSINHSPSDSDNSFWDDNDSGAEEVLLVKKASNANTLSGNTQIMVHQNVTRLANKLFANAKNIHLAQSVAIGTFLPIHLTNAPDLAEQDFIGLQIQESFITLAAQAGLNVVEFKTVSAIKIASNADVMLSRNIKDLKDDVNVQYFLTGTYSEHDNKLMVNARIIELSNQRVIAAATDTIAMPSLNNQQKTSMKNNMLYRKSL